MTTRKTTTRTTPSRKRRWLGLIARCFRGLLGVLKDLLDPKAGRAVDTRARARGTDGPRACALVLDASGSMTDTDWKPSRLDAAIDAAKAFAGRLTNDEPDASVAVVAYGCSATTVCQPTRARDLSRIHDAIDQIDIMGSTNMRAGLKEALRQLGRDRGRMCQVVLLSDGHNTGRSPRKIADELKEFAVVECVGIGGRPTDVDEALLKGLASSDPAGKPMYRWIGDRERLVRHFHDLAGRITRS